MAMIDISKGVVSFRSVKDDIDLGGEIAHSLGGGGHKKAAGSTFKVSEVNGYLLRNVIGIGDTFEWRTQWLGEKVKKEDTSES